MYRRFLVASLLFLLASCQTPTPSPTPTPAAPSVTPTRLPTTATLPPEILPSPTPTTGAVQTGEDIAPFTVDIASSFGTTQLTGWQPSSFAGMDYALPLDLSQVTNLGVISGLTDPQQAFLSQNGFVVIHSQEDQFHTIRSRVSKKYGQPYYFTTDAAFHALHITFDELLKALEKEQLHPSMIALTQAVLDEVSSYLPLVQGSPIENDTQLAAAYLSVALKLFDPQASLDPSLEDLVSPQIEQIMAGGARDYSVLIPKFEDDYGAYKPIGHYAGDPALENYFRGMTWFGRVHFKLKDVDSSFVPSRAPLIITLALRRAQVSYWTGAEEWGQIHEVLTFLVGPSDDSGPVEFASLMDQIYGRYATIHDLADEALWQAFLELGDELPSPQINSTFVNFLSELEEERGWRFMGQRFTLDAFILQNLVFDNVGTIEDQRRLPSGLDVMAAFGSQSAMQALEKAGETNYLHYPEQMAHLQEAVEAQPETEWLNTFYSSWLYAFFPQLAAKEVQYPTYMLTGAWAYKDLNSALGSWAELKHDTALYAKMPEAAGGGGPPSSGPAPSYVEPNPEVFYRLAYVAHVIIDGLTERTMVISLAEPQPGDFTYPDGIDSLISKTGRLADKFQRLGDIAAKELAGVPLDEDDLWTIQDCLGPVECQVLYMQTMHGYGVGPEQEMLPVPVVAAVAGAEAEVLEVGVGSVDRIYVVVPLEGGLEVAQGGVFSYYEFPQPRSERLTDQEWREKLASSPPDQPAWVDNFLITGGEPVDHLAFRIGDVYLITEEGADLNLREDPSTSAQVIYKLQPTEYIEIVDGPVDGDEYTWWKIRLLNYVDPPTEGWAVDHQEWYERAWGQ